MINGFLTGILIAGIFFIVGLLIQIFGQNYKDKKEHERNLEKISAEFILKEKIESFKKINKILYEIKRRTINFLVGIEKNDVSGELILELNKESFLFSNQETLKEIKENTNIIQKIIDNPPQIVKIENNKVFTNQEELGKVVKQMGNAQGKILKTLRKELQI